MTEPIDFPMPYAVQFQAKTEGEALFNIPPAQRLKGSATNHYLSPGTYQVQVTWDGEQAIQLTYKKGTFWVVEIAIEENPGGNNSGTDRISRMMSVTVPDGFGDMVIRLAIPHTSPPISASNISQNNTATLIVYPTMSHGESTV